MMVQAFTLDTNDVVAEAGDAMDANMIVKGSPRGASDGSGRSNDSEFVCWYCEKKVMANIRMSLQRDHNMAQSKGSRMVDNKGRSERRPKCKCHECGKFGLGMSATEASAFEASKRVLAETTYVDMTSVDLNTLEIASLSLLERNLEFQSGIESYAAVTVFALFGVQSRTSCLNLSARKVIGKLREGRSGTRI